MSGETPPKSVDRWLSTRDLLDAIGHPPQFTCVNPELGVPLLFTAFFTPALKNVPAATELLGPPHLSWPFKGDSAGRHDLLGYELWRLPWHRPNVHLPSARFYFFIQEIVSAWKMDPIRKLNKLVLTTFSRPRV